MGGFIDQWTMTGPLLAPDGHIGAGKVSTAIVTSPMTSPAYMCRLEEAIREPIRDSNRGGSAML